MLLYVPDHANKERESVGVAGELQEDARVRAKFPESTAAIRRALDRWRRNTALQQAQKATPRHVHVVSSEFASESSSACPPSGDR